MAIRSVSNQAQLDAAIQASRSGDTILLGSGTYDRLVINGAKTGNENLKYTWPVTIRSADEANPAVINELMFRQTQKVVLENVKLGYAAGLAGAKPFTVEKSDGVTFNNVEIDGRSGGEIGAVGLRVTDSLNFTIKNSDIHHWNNGLSFRGMENLTVVDNTFKHMKNDAMFMQDLDVARIIRNHYSEMDAPVGSAHKDMMQFATGAGVPPSQNVTIRDNTIINPNSSHGIFFGNESAKNGDLTAFYRNILIENNTLNTAHVHGITVDHGNGVTIRNNTLTPNTALGFDTKGDAPLINVSTQSENVTIANNTAPSVPPEHDSSWSVYGNDVDSRVYLHWTENYGDQPPPPEPEPVDPDAPVIVDRNLGVFRIKAAEATGEAPRLIEDFDFAGDKLTFNKFDAGTFVTTPEIEQFSRWDAGGSATFMSALAIHLVDELSDRMEARASGDDMIIELDQNGGQATVIVADFADEYLAARPSDDPLGREPVVVERSGSVYRVGSWNALGEPPRLIEEVNLATERISIRGFDANTFQKNATGNKLNIWDSGGSVEIDSAMDLQELALLSPRVTARTSGDDVHLDVAQGGKVARIIIGDLADAFTAADHPELF